MLETVRPEPPASRLIKRYPNRKLYDTQERRYVSLADVAEVMESGAEVKVVDHRTSRDLTRATLAALLLRRERRAARAGEGVAHAFDAAPCAEDAAALARAGDEHRLAELVDRAERAHDRAEEAWGGSQAVVAELQSALTERLGEAWTLVAEVGKVNRELRYLRGRIDELGARVRALRGSPRSAAPRA